ncbi:MAG: hypothetical protein FJZ11_00200 [Candidatus Omnitrophica bacterium]|nr:hypothetical protein [Candidatus Omnitrophota bacterium]
MDKIIRDKATGPLEANVSQTIATLYLSWFLLFRARIFFSRPAWLKIIYFKANPLAKFLLVLLKKIKRQPVILIELPCLPYYLPASELCDAKGNNLRKEINEKIIVLARSLFLLFKKEPGWGRMFPAVSAGKFIPEYEKYRIAGAIQNYVFFAYHLYSCFLKNKTMDNQEYMLYIPSTWWSDEFINQLKNLPVKIAKGRKACLDINFRLLKNSRNNKGRAQEVNINGDYVIEAGLRHFNKSQSSPGCYKTFVGTTIYSRIGSDLRNSLNWAWDDSFDKGRIVAVLADENNGVRESEINLANMMNMKVYRQSRRATASGRLALWKPTRRYYLTICRLTMNFFRLFCQNLPQIDSKYLWRYAQVFRSLKGIAWWYDFFCAHNIKVYIEEMFGEYVFERAIAIDMAGGVNMLTERSVLYSNNSFLDFRPAFISFLSGEHSLKYFIKQESLMHKVICGFYYDQTDRGSLDEQAKALQQRLGLEGAYRDAKLILICDEMGLIYGFNEVVNFYRHLLRDLENKAGYNILIKSKKEIIFNRLPGDLNNIFIDMVKRKRCFILSPDTTISLSLKVSDLTITLPSTAMFNSIAMGQRTAVLNPYRTIDGVFYEQGLANQSIFLDMESLLDNLHRYIEGKNDKFGDCAGIRRILDPYQDLGASQRIGYYVNSFIEKIVQTKNRDQAMEYANKRFADLWGKDKIFAIKESNVI